MSKLNTHALTFIDFTFEEFEGHENYVMVGACVSTREHPGSFDSGLEPIRREYEVYLVVRLTVGCMPRCPPWGFVWEVLARVTL